MTNDVTFTTDQMIEELTACAEYITNNPDTHIWDIIGGSYHDVARLFMELQQAAYADTLDEQLECEGMIEYEKHLIQIMHAYYIVCEKDIILDALNNAIDWMTEQQKLFSRHR